MTMVNSLSSPQGAPCMAIPPEIDSQKEPQSPPPAQADLSLKPPSSVGQGSAPAIEPPRSSVEMLLLAIQTYSDGFGTAFQKFKLDQTKGQQSQMDDILKKNLENFKNWVQEVEKQRAAQADQSIFGWISKIATVVVGLVATYATGAALAASFTGVGLVAFAIAALVLTTTVMDLAGDSGGKDKNPLTDLGVGATALRLDFPGLAAAAAKACGFDAKTQEIIAIAATVMQIPAMFHLGKKFAPEMVGRVAKMTQVVAALGAITGGTSKVSHGAISVQRVIPAQERAGNLSANMIDQQVQTTERRKLIESCHELILAMAECEQVLIENCTQALRAWADSMMPSRGASARRGPVMA